MPILASSTPLRLIEDFRSNSALPSLLRVRFGACRWNRVFEPGHDSPYRLFLIAAQRYRSVVSVGAEPSSPLRTEGIPTPPPDTHVPITALRGAGGVTFPEVRADTDCCPCHFDSPVIET